MADRDPVAPHAGAADVSPCGDNPKRLRVYAIGGSLNRLSKLQKSLIERAYRNYAANPGLAPSDTASMHGKVAHEQCPNVGVAHLYSAHAVADWLGVKRRQEDYKTSIWGNQFCIHGNGWGTRVDEKAYASAQATIARAFRRLEARGLVQRMERGFMYQ